MITIYIINNKKLESIDITQLESVSYEKIWIDITNISKEESEILGKNFNLHQLVTEDLFNSNTRIKIEEFTDYLFFVFYTLKNRETLEFIELDFIINNKFLITNHREPIKSYEKLKNDNEKLLKIFERGTDFLFHRLIDKEVDDFYSVLEFISESIELLEEEAIKNTDRELMSRILSLKREINKMRKIVLAQREKFSYLTKNDLQFISKKSLPYFRDVYDHIIRASDFSDDLKETISNTYDLYMTTLSHKMNESMMVLSVFATISLPLGVISGIYGTNFIKLPGSEFTYGFWVMILLMLILSSSMLLFFKRRGWF
jgi:magnesium transporter